MLKIESFKVLKVAGTPFEMGKQRGEKFKGKINGGKAMELLKKLVK